MYQQIAALGGAFLLAVIITPIYRSLAIRIGMVDRPDRTRKLHSNEVAIAGGIAVFLALFLTGIGAIVCIRPLRNAIIVNPAPVVGLAVSALAIVILGLLDDKFTIRGRQKLAGQVVATAFLVLCGYRMDVLQFFGYQIPLGLMAVPISIGWILFTVNALNLIDGADGLCSTVGWVASAGIAAMALISGHQVESIVAAGLAGALLGFLVYNFPPAKIFLGDTGSMLVGLLLGALSLRCALKEATATSLLVPVTILSIPIFDSVMAILRRKLTGRSIFAVDRGHLHHNLLRRGFSNRGLVIVVTLLSGTVAIGAFLGLLWKSDWIAFLSMGIALGGLVVGRLFGHKELKLLGTRAMTFGGSLFELRGRSMDEAQLQMVRLQGSRAWETIWESFIEFAEKHELCKICMDLNVPWLHEGFHASWQRHQLPELADRWTTKLPIVADGRIYGRLEVVGKAKSASVFKTLALLAELMELVQPEVSKLGAEVPFQPSNPETVSYSVSFASPTAATRTSDV